MQLDFAYYNSLILYEDNKIAIINKPHGLAVQGGSKVKNSVDKIYRSENGFKFNAYLVHRLDKDTSGALLLAKNAKSAKKMSNIINQKEQISKEYLALVKGALKPKQGNINFYLSKKYLGKSEKTVIANKQDPDAKYAKTLYSTLDFSGKTASLLKLELVTGRKHQLRVHLNHIGHPIIADGKYGGKEAFINCCGNKMHLHAHQLIIKNYIDGKKELKVKAAIPDFFQESLDNLSLNSKI